MDDDKAQSGPKAGATPGVGDAKNSRPPISGALRWHPLTLIAVAGGAGYAPKAPGTVGSFAALLPLYWLSQLPLAAYLAVVAAAFGIGVWASHHVVRSLHVEDHQSIVWDEVVGVWITLAGASAVTGGDWLWLLVGVGLFRCFDIAKPWLIGWTDAKVHGGLGVMLDDAVAGAAAFLSLWALQSLLQAVGLAL